MIIEIGILILHFLNILDYLSHFFDYVVLHLLLSESLNIQSLFVQISPSMMEKDVSSLLEYLD